MNRDKFRTVMLALGWGLFLTSEIRHWDDRSSKSPHSVTPPAVPAATPISEATAAQIDTSASPAVQSLELVRARSQVTALRTQYDNLKDQLRSVEKQLVASGQPKPYEFDTTPSEWKDLAEEGHIKYRVPCWKPDWTLSDKDSDRLGLSPDDRKAVMAAYKQSGERMLQMAYTLCGTFMDRKDAIYAMGPDQCIAMTERVAARFGVKDAGIAAKKFVSETRAGLNPAPSQEPWIQRLVVAYSALVDEGNLFQRDLEAQLGPDDAARIWHEFPCDRTEQ